MFANAGYSLWVASSGVWESFMVPISKKKYRIWFLYQIFFIITEFWVWIRFGEKSLDPDWLNPNPQHRRKLITENKNKTCEPKPILQKDFHSCWEEGILRYAEWYLDK